ncbi:hypothetical protein Hanom_Chr00s002307g01695351 [Helianthus anomalus]
MELTSRMKMARFQTFWIQMRKNKSLHGSRKTSQTLGTKMTFYSFKKRENKAGQPYPGRLMRTYQIHPTHKCEKSWLPF